MDQTRHSEADSLFRRGLAMRLELQGESQPDYAVDLASYADLLRAQSRYADAVSRYTRALELLRAALGGESSWEIATRTGLGQTLLRLDRRAEAEAVLAEAVQIAEQTFGVDHPLYQSASAALVRAQRR